MFPAGITPTPSSLLDVSLRGHKHPNVPAKITPQADRPWGSGLAGYIVCHLSILQGTMILGPRASEECSIAGSIGPEPEGPPVNEMTNSRSIQPASPALAQTLDGPAVRVTTLPSPPPGTSQAPSKPANTNSAPPARMRWPQLGPMDIVWLTHLAEFQPFAVQKKVNERFHMCTAHIKVSEAWFECLMSFSLTLRPDPLSNVCRHMQTQPKCLSCSQAIPKQPH